MRVLMCHSLWIASVFIMNLMRKEFRAKKLDGIMTQEVHVSIIMEVDTCKSKEDIRDVLYNIVSNGLYPHEPEFTFIKVGDIKEESEIYGLE